MTTPSNVSFSCLCAALQEARAIHNKYKAEYTDIHSIWMGRWIDKAETYTLKANSDSDTKKKEIADKLINKLFTQILASPYDRSPFIPRAKERPVLFKGIIFPFWMLEDILKSLRKPEALSLAKQHEFLNEMLDWKNALEKGEPSATTKNTDLVPLDNENQLILSNETVLSAQLNSELLVCNDFSENLPMTIKKLLTYQDLMKKAFREIELREMKREVKEQIKQMTIFQNEQEILAEQQKEKFQLDRIVHEQNITKCFEDIACIHESTQNFMKQNFQSLIDQIKETQENLIQVQEDCKNKEAQKEYYLNAQANLHV